MNNPLVSCRYIVDSSIWISLLRKDCNPELITMVARILENSNVVLVCPVLTEILSGARNEFDFKRLSDKFSVFELLKDGSEIWIATAKMQSELRNAGFLVPLMDTLIANYAINYDCILIHNDKHYEIIAKRYPAFTGQRLNFEVK